MTRLKLDGDGRGGVLEEERGDKAILFREKKPGWKTN